MRILKIFYRKQNDFGFIYCHWLSLFHGIREYLISGFCQSLHTKPFEDLYIWICGSHVPTKPIKISIQWRSINLQYQYIKVNKKRCYSCKIEFSISYTSYCVYRYRTSSSFCDVNRIFIIKSFARRISARLSSIKYVWTEINLPSYTFEVVNDFSNEIKKNLLNILLVVFWILYRYQSKLNPFIV